MYFIDNMIDNDARLGVGSLFRIIADTVGTDIDKLAEKFSVNLDEIDDHTAIMSVKNEGTGASDGRLIITLPALEVIEFALNNKCTEDNLVSVELIISGIYNLCEKYGYDTNILEMLYEIKGIAEENSKIAEPIALISEELWAAVKPGLVIFNEQDSVISPDTEEYTETTLPTDKFDSDDEFDYQDIEEALSSFNVRTTGVCDDNDIDKIEDVLMTALVSDYKHIVVRSDNYVIARTAVLRAINKLAQRGLYFCADMFDGASVIQGFTGSYVDGRKSIVYTSNKNDEDIKNILIVSPLKGFRSNIATEPNISFNGIVKARVDLVGRDDPVGRDNVVIDLNESVNNKMASLRYAPDQYIDGKVEYIDNEAYGVIHKELKNGRRDKEIQTLVVEAYKNSVIDHRKGINGSDMKKAISKLNWGKTDYSVVRGLKETLKKDIKGQERAIDEVCRAVKIASVGLNDTDKPIVSMMFVGPTGTGKTETAKQLAKALNRKFIRIDMSEYADETAVNKINGSSAGYVGYDDGSILAKLVSGNEKCVLLFDEIEKAHPKVFDTLLQILDNGILHDNKGRSINFRKAIIIMTSNSGIQDMGKRGVGFNSAEKVDVRNSKGISECVEQALRKNFRDEFINRIDYIVQFNSITVPVAKEIASKLMDDLTAKLPNKVVVDDSCYNMLADKGIDIRYGAREIKRVISQEIKSAIAEAIVDNNISKKSEIIVGYEGDHIKVDFRKNK